jgi:hypothetical protein
MTPRTHHDRTPADAREEAKRRAAHRERRDEPVDMIDVINEPALASWLED